MIVPSESRKGSVSNLGKGQNVAWNRVGLRKENRGTNVASERQRPEKQI